MTCVMCIRFARPDACRAELASTTAEAGSRAESLIRTSDRFLESNRTAIAHTDGPIV